MHFTTSKTKRLIFYPLLKIFAWITPRFPIMVAKIRYFERFKKHINLDNPKDINEKIIWLSINSDTREWSRLSDKYRVREYVKSCGLNDILIPFYGIWNDAESINYDNLPNSFALKSTNGSGGNIFIYDKSQVDFYALKIKIQSMFNKKLSLTGPGDLHYIRIKNRILAEGLLINDSLSQKYSKTLIDYKIWCFNGKANNILTCSNRTEKSVCLGSYDLAWNYCPENLQPSNEYPLEIERIPKPVNLDRMIQIAEILSKPFPQVRIDLYNINGTIYFGEITFTSLGGLMNYYSPEFLVECGKLIDISNVSTKGKWKNNE